MSLTNFALKLATGAQFRAFNKATLDPQAAYTRLWSHIGHEVGESPFWRRKWGKGGPPPTIGGLPIRDYGDYQQPIRKGFESGISPLSNLPVVYWAHSGGTTATTPKLFPVTASYRTQVSAISQSFAYSLACRVPHLPLAPTVSFAAARSGEFSPHGVEVGYISHFALSTTSGLMGKLSAIAPAVYHRREDFRQWGPLYALRCDLLALSAVNAAKLVSFLESLHERIPHCWEYLEGKKSPPSHLPPCRVSTKRLHYLRRVFDNPRPSIDQIWPSLRFLLCWKSAVSALQLPRLRPFAPHLPILDSPYIATEGWMTVPLVNELPGGVLHPGTNIVEFLPYGESPEARLLLQPWQLEAGEKYEVILTTSMGLLRYRLHDVVQCHGFYNRSPIIEFCHKTEFVLRLGQVSIDEKQLCNALGRIEVEINEDIMIGPNANGDALTIYLKEQIEDERQIDMAKKLERFDHLLGEELVVYRQDREVGDLKPVELVMLAHNHQAWQRPDHMQSKSRLLVPTPLSQL